jgi:hypothetical protein
MMGHAERDAAERVLAQNPVWQRAKQLAAEGQKLGLDVPGYPVPEAATMSILIYAAAIGVADMVGEMPPDRAQMKMREALGIAMDQLCEIAPCAWTIRHG